ncbi:MAG: cupin domain-containing protein [Candidatus Sericytochromatia bacterium]
MEKYIKQDNPFIIPTTDGKLIEEHFGMASTKDNAFSIARMVAPANWTEPHQTPDFDEITIMIKGKKVLEVNGEKITVKAGESILIKKGSRVRYSNPFDEDAEYWSVCIPAFSIDLVNREAD